MTEQISWDYIVEETAVGMRVDKLASTQLAEFSRANIQEWLESGALTVNSAQVKPKYLLKLADNLQLRTTLSQKTEDMPENIPLEVLYEDDCLLVINKPAGLVVHAGAGNPSGTLVNALLYHYPTQATLPRAGLVHRIDKDTTGLLLIAKTSYARQHLSDQLKDKTLYRHYQCVVQGIPELLRRHAVIDAPIARHPVQRTKMAVRSNGKPAVTHITAITALGSCHCLLDIALQTGRTHQIRVHLSHLGYPLVGDKTYGGAIKAGLSSSLRQTVLAFPRQALHAYRLGFIQPKTGESVVVTAPLPTDMQTLIHKLDKEG